MINDDNNKDVIVDKKETIVNVENENNEHGDEVTNENNKDTVENKKDSNENNKETIVNVENENNENGDDITHENNNTIEKTPKSKKRLILFIILGILLLLILIILIVGIIYVNIYYHATTNAMTYTTNLEDDVKVNKIKSGYFFDGPGTDKALIFYPGAKVEETAYSGLLYQLAKNGIDCYLVKMPFRLAILGKNKAEGIIKENKDWYDQWYIAGHSLGGAMASYFVHDHSDVIDGLALLAAYATKPIPQDIKVVSLLGSNDKVLSWDKYENNKKNLPTSFKEVKIEGGNHGQFGDYGHQKGDGDASISLEKQHNITVSAILEAFN